MRPSRVSVDESPLPCSKVTELFDRLYTVASLGLEETALKSYVDDLQTRIGADHKTMHTVCAATNAFLVLASYAVVTGHGATLIANGELSLEAFFRIVTGLSLILLFPCASPVIATFARDLEIAHKASATIASLMDRPLTIDSTSDEGFKPRTSRGKIEFHNVTFCDPKRSVGLDKFTATVNAGLYDPTDGEVLLDGINLHELHVATLCDRVGLVERYPRLFTGGMFSHTFSIEDNIAIGVTPTPPSRKVVSAAKLANADEFITKHHEGYACNVTSPSRLVGENECLALARAVVKHPSVLVLDDVVDNLLQNPTVLKMDDVATPLVVVGRGLVNKGVDNVLASGQKRTTILIGHRFAATHRVDRIFVLDNGAVVEQGAHDELVAAGGFYAKLVEPTASTPAA